MAKGVQRNIRNIRTMDLPITKAIMAINVAVFIMTEFVGRSTKTPVTKANLALNPIYIYDGQWWRLITSGFLHFGFLHIAFNMAIFYRLGETFERTLGAWRFVGLFTVCLLGGSFGAVLFEAFPTPLSFSQSGGASGAVFGLAGAAAIALHQRGVKFSQTTWGPLLVINLIITFVVPGISKGGHLGGLAFGITAGAILFHPRRRGRSLPIDMAILVLFMVVAVGLSFYFAHNPLNNGQGLFQ